MSENFVLSKNSADKVKWVVDSYMSTYSPEKAVGFGNLPPFAPNKRGWLVQDVAYGEIASVLIGEYNPAFTTIKLDQFGLWSIAPQFTLKIFLSGTQVAEQAFNNPTCTQLSTAFGCQTFLGNPVSSNSSDWDITPNSLGSGKIDHGCWLLVFNNPNITAEVVSTNGALVEGKAFEVSVSHDIPTGVEQAFDVYDLEWPLNRGSKVILQWFQDRGYGITSAYPKQFIR